MARNIGLGVLAFLGMRTVYFHVLDLIATDPFARLQEEANTGIDDRVGILLDNVRLRAYRHGQLETSAETDRVEISKDRQEVTLTGIHDGVFKQDGNTYRYEADKGIWNANARRLAISGSARILNADLDLRTGALEFDERAHTLGTPQPVSGRLFKGSFTARGFHLDTQSDGYDTGPIDYRGDLTMLQKQEDGDTVVTKQWHFTGEASKGVRATKTSPALTYWMEGRAEDDEMIVKADLVTQYKDSDVFKATGNVKYYSAKADVTADRSTVYRKEKRIVLVGHVTIYVKPKSEEEKPPVEESTPDFHRATPEQMAALTDRATEKTQAGATAAGSPTLKGSQPSDRASAKTSGAPVLPAAGAVQTPASAVSAPVQTPPPAAPASPPPSSAPGAAPQSTSSAGTTTQVPGSQNPAPLSGSTTAKPPQSKLPAKSPGVPQTKSTQKGAPTPEEKKLDEDLRSGKTIRQYPMVIVCDQVEYWYRKGQRHGHVSGSPQGRQDLPKGRWRYVWSTSADYDAEKDELTLLSSTGKIDVRMENSKGDDLTALVLTVSTKEDADEEEYRGRKVTGVGLVDEDDDLAAKKKSPGEKTSPKPAPVKTGGG